MVFKHNAPIATLVRQILSPTDLFSHSVDPEDVKSLRARKGEFSLHDLNIREDGYDKGLASSNVLYINDKN